MGKTRIISHYYLIETFFLGFFFLGLFFRFLTVMILSQSMKVSIESRLFRRSVKILAIKRLTVNARIVFSVNFLYD